METQALQHIHIYTEASPNPNSMKFVLNLVLTPEGKDFNFTPDAPLSQSPLAEALFDFPFVAKVFVASNFVTVAKTDNVPWDFITMELREFIREWIAFGKEVLIAMPSQIQLDPEDTNVTAASESSAVLPKFAASDLDDAIADLLDQYVRPAVANDGGAIDFLGFEDGKVTVLLKGSCAGCPSSTATLKGGIENLLKQHLPEVKEVVAFNG